KVADSTFYAASGSTFYISTDSGVTFAATAGTLGSSTTANKITVNVKVTGDVWVSTDAGLFHSTNSGASFTAVTGFGATWSISTGAPKTTGGYPSVFAIGTYNRVIGVYRSDDQGSSWSRLDDAAHAFGAASANVVSGDQRIWGRVYVGTNGRGIFYGNESGTSTSTTTSKSSTTTSSSTTKTSSSSTTTSKTSSTTSKTSSTTSKTSSTTSKTSSTTTKTTTTTTATTSASGTACHWCQCGGIGYTGPKTCASPYVCTYQNDWYYQCL
ncbi:hypothetical protein FRC01_012653, partial [Tulasnella sp. 417]